MRILIYTLAVVSVAFIVGCGKSGEENKNVSSAKSVIPVKSATEYREILEKRVSSPRGCDIDIRKEVSEFERSSDDEKRKMYNKQEELAR